ncbi:MAG: endonuclease/exonuclease/phosphatase family protein [Candidatus Komeilibacteria bacterium]|nr:endonuclease/exonuclease/phosphatase family protein [Candidatus Komeilibacteria bacterium]
MKLLTLNLWGGTVYQPLIRFIKQQGKTVDVFCFQEVFNTTANKKVSGQIRTNLFQELQKVLPNHQACFAGAIKGFNMTGPVNFNLEFGLAMFIRKNIEVERLGEVFVNRRKNSPVSRIASMPRNLLYAVVKHQQKKYLIANMHGLWNNGPKTDTPDRIKQSQKARRLLDKFSCAKLICGDFNLLPTTKSVAILDKGMVNLVKKHKVKSTRTKFYRSFKTKPLFADYIIVSPDLKTKNFQVLKNVVSDHSPLAVEFN